MKKRIAMILAVVLLIGIAVGATIAWLTDSTQEVQNTFTVGNIDITLEETDSPDDEDDDTDKNDYKMIPGWTITKDPVATVLANSEDCYLFIKLEKSANFEAFMTYEMADGWTLLGANYPGIYYREVETNAADQEFHVIKNDTVTVLDSVTKQMMDGLTEDTYPTLNVTAYAIQRDKTNNTPFGAENAWKEIAG